MNENNSPIYEEIVVAFGRKYPCRFERQADGEYRATCRDFPSAVVIGKTINEARAAMGEELGFRLDHAYELDYPVISGD